MTLLEDIQRQACVVDDYILGQLSGRELRLWDAARHFIQAGGKRLRPYIVMQCFKMIHPTADDHVEKVIPLASAIEVLHTFTLIHDDIMDQDDFRRGVPTVHSKWGVPLGILSGDLLFALAFQFIDKSEFTPAVKSLLSSALSKVGVALCEGQTMDMEFERSPAVSITDYIEMVALKTGALFSTSALFGGIMAGATADDLMALELYGKNLGIAFQIADDILGLTGNEQEFGKPVGSDLREGKKTFLTLYTASQLVEADRQKFIKKLSQTNKSSEEIAFLLSQVHHVGAIEQAQQLGSDYVQQAILALNSFPASHASQNLIAIAKVALTRTK